jgi:hypothetical protein
VSGAESKSDLNFTELALDKLVDFVLVFVGLYAAIAVQRWQDDAKEKDEYLRLLSDFRGELVANQAQKKTIEKDLGLVSERETGKALGPLQGTFDEFGRDAIEAGKLLECVSVMVKAAAPKAPPRLGERARACAPLLDAEAEHDDDKFKPANLSPLYRTEVYQVYIANGIKVFENKDLAVKIGQAYSSGRTVERGVAEIETLYNDGFMQKAGELEALSAELEDALPEGVDLVGSGPAIEAKIQQAAKEVTAQRYGALKIQAVLELKAIRLKELLDGMDRHFAAVVAEIDKELAAKKR